MNKLAQAIVLNAFEEELEKLAGLPRAVREGQGGRLGELLRAAKLYGQQAGPKIREYVRTKDAPGFWGKEPLVRRLHEEADRSVRLGKERKRSANTLMRVSTRYPHDAFERRRVQSPELFRRLQEARKKAGLEKLSYMYAGARHPSGEELTSSSLPYKKRRKAFEHYAGKKSREGASSVGAALGGGMALGTPLGALAGAGIGGGRGLVAGSIIGALAGAGLGALAREADKSEIKLMRRVIKDADKLDRLLQRRVASASASQKMLDRADKAARHAELIDAIRSR